jgi:hypothetical protein
MQKSYTVTDWLRATWELSYALSDTTIIKTNTPIIICADGFGLTVNAGMNWRSRPNIDNCAYWEEVEIYQWGYDHTGYWNRTGLHPNTEPKGYVPVKVVDRVIAKHGGFNEDCLRILEQGASEDYINAVNRTRVAWELELKRLTERLAYYTFKE